MDAFEKFMKQAFEKKAPMPRQGPGPGCPGEEALGGYLEGVGTAEERSSIESHLAGCAYCLDTIEIYAQVHAAPEGEVSARSLEVREAEERILHESMASAAPQEAPAATSKATPITLEKVRLSTWDRLLPRLRLALEDAMDRLRIFPQPSYAFATVAVAAALVCIVVLTQLTTGPLTGPNRLDLSAFGVPHAVVRAPGVEGQAVAAGTVGLEDYLRLDIPLADPSGRLTGLFFEPAGGLVDIMKIDFAKGGPECFTISTDSRGAEVGVDIGESSVLMESRASQLFGDHFGRIRILLLLTEEPPREGVIEELVQEVMGSGDKLEQWEAVVLEWGKGKLRHYGLDEIDYRAGGEL